MLGRKDKWAAVGEWGGSARRVRTLDNLQPDLVLNGAVQGQVAQTGHAGVSSAPIGAGPLALWQFKCGDRDAGRVRGHRGELTIGIR